jgi:hypothetical protein
LKTPHITSNRRGNGLFSFSPKQINIHLNKIPVQKRSQSKTIAQSQELKARIQQEFQEFKNPKLRACLNQSYDPSRTFFEPTKPTLTPSSATHTSPKSQQDTQHSSLHAKKQLKFEKIRQNLKDKKEEQWQEPRKKSDSY